MASQGSFCVHSKRDVSLRLEWDEYQNQIVIERGDIPLVLTYDETRELYKFLFFLFGRVAMPEIH